MCVGKPEGKRPLARPLLRWADNIKMDVADIGWGGVEWIGLAQDREKCRTLVNIVMNFEFRTLLGNYPVAAQRLGSIQLVWLQLSNLQTRR
jgi:hypothetical protein